MMEILYLLSVVGVVGIITRSKLFKRVREFASRTREKNKFKWVRKLFWLLASWVNCPFCASIWVGLVILVPYTYGFTIILLPLSGAGILWILSETFQFIDE